jgi:hypothetical protein
MESDDNQPVTVKVLAVEEVNQLIMPGALLDLFGLKMFSEQLTVTIIRNDCECYSTTVWTYIDEVQPEPWKA